MDRAPQLFPKKAWLLPCDELLPALRPGPRTPQFATALGSRLFANARSPSRTFPRADPAVPTPLVPVHCWVPFARLYPAESNSAADILVVCLIIRRMPEIESTAKGYPSPAPVPDLHGLNPVKPSSFDEMPLPGTVHRVAPKSDGW